MRQEKLIYSEAIEKVLLTNNYVAPLRKIYKEIITANCTFLKNKSKKEKYDLLKIVTEKIDSLLDLLSSKENSVFEIDYNNTFEFFLYLINCVTYFKEQAQYFFIKKNSNDFTPSVSRIKTIAKLNQYLKNYAPSPSKKEIFRYLKKIIENENKELKRLLT